jgi:hypothetical protein
MRARRDHEVTCRISQPELIRLLELTKPLPPAPHDDFDEEESPIKGLSARAGRLGALLVSAVVTVGAALMLTMLIA